MLAPTRGTDRRGRRFLQKIRREQAPALRHYRQSVRFLDFARNDMGGLQSDLEAAPTEQKFCVFADKIDGFDAIAIGPQMYDVHTVNERLEIKSVGEIYKLLLKILEKCR